MNIANFLITNAQNYPLKQAIGFKSGAGWSHLNWRKLKTVVFKTANALKEAGIQKGDRVAIYSDNSAEWITMDLATLAIGAVTVPIYSTNTKDQAKHVILDSGAKIILTGNKEHYDNAIALLEECPSLEKIIVTKTYERIIHDQSVHLQKFIKPASENLEILDMQEDDLATIIYTSGTTGTPKGVMLMHGNFVKAFDAHFEFFKFKNFEDEHSFAFLPLTHVFERSWTLLAMSGGAKVSFLTNTKAIAEELPIVQPTMMCSVPRFYQKIYIKIQETIQSSSPTKQKIFNWALGVGSQYHELKRQEKSIPLGLSLKYNLANTLVFKKIKGQLGGRLWFMPCGGASISPEIAKFFDAMGIHLTVGYGLTETTATLALYPLTKYKFGTTGRTLPGVEIKIGDDEEILAKGNGIMKGYYNRPEETAKVFTEDGWFRTGDCGTIDAEGNLTITDRIKDLMKTSNGKYISPQATENLLTNDAFVQQAVLIAEGRSYVTALIVPNFETLEEKAKQENITYQSHEDLIKNPIVVEFYNQKINELQKDLASYEKIKKISLLPRDFQMDLGEMTPTLKVRRKVVVEKFADLIDEMYKGH
ncbi:long-chain acyl-CoA synthetase [Soonwooa buanensis]|uniref:Long-chain acyl-CoA synthetase n=1 Tax=Soonwooa buanensis TaxID=619805 RepID=A0A1T5GIG8_9FLAO|nr:long-chain fatty acid--CoA ligase [Soonwooa buanensis]SKC08208.1 long-chain acyl-CoA synthetase [Soonwooa buanensis]